MIKPPIILGSEAYGKTVLDIAEQLGYNPIIVLDDADQAHPLSSYKAYLNMPYAEYIVAFGNNEFRLSWLSKLKKSGATLATLIHPSAYVNPKAVIDPGTVILTYLFSHPCHCEPVRTLVWQSRFFWIFPELFTEGNRGY